MIRTDLQGLVDNLKISPSRHALQPIFEAVSNSLHAIQAANEDQGQILIVLARDPSQGWLQLASDRGDPSERTLPEITSVQVIDNGVGFTHDNYASFLKLGSRQKAKTGGKGIGRLTWLKAFDRTYIDSAYHDDDGMRRRRFAFCLPDGIVDHEDMKVEQLQVETTVILSGLHPAFAPHLRHRAITIGKEITKHFLSHFLSGTIPAIQIRDGDEVVSVSLDDLIGKTRADFALGEQTFSIDHVKIKSPVERRHSIYYCADGRVVKPERLRSLPSSRLHDEQEPFYYQAYVSSSFLDSNVNQERTGFLIEEESALIDEVSYSALRAEVESSANAFLHPYLTALDSEREARIANVLDHRFPEYRYIRIYNENDLKQIPYEATEADIAATVAGIHFSNQKTGRMLLESVVAEMESVASFDAETFTEKFESRFENFNRINQANLISYLLFRRSIIELYEQILRKSGGEFQREAAVHSLIFPMGRDHDTSEAYL